MKNIEKTCKRTKRTKTIKTTIMVIITKIICICFILCLSLNFVCATEMEQVADETDLASLIDVLEEYSNEDIDIEEMSQSLINGEGIDYGVIGNFVINKLFYEIRLGLKSSISILIIIVIMAVINSLELQKDSNISKVTNLTGFLVIVTIVLKTYIAMLTDFIGTIDTITKIIEIIAPFMLALLIATGEVVTSGIISPVLLFVTSLIGVLITYIILPLLNVSLIFKLISNMADGIKLDKFSQLFSKTAMWIISVVFTIFLAIMELESTLACSIDEVAIKTTQAAASNLIPVVGKFVSDSVEVVMGASEVIGKSVGIIGIVIILISAIIPIIKLTINMTVNFVLAAIAEALNTDVKIINLCESMSKQYKTLLGIMIGVMVTFVIGLAIIIKLMGRIAV